MLFYNVHGIYGMYLRIPNFTCKLNHRDNLFMSRYIASGFRQIHTKL